MAAVVSCLAVGSGSSAASARTHCIGSKPIGRTTTSSRATGSQQQLGLADDLAQLGLDACRADQLFEVLQPVAALAAERHGIGLARVQQVDEGVAGLSALRIRRRGRWNLPCVPVVTLSCSSLIVTSCHLLGAASRAYRVVLVYGLSSSRRVPCSPARSCDSASNPDWLRPRPAGRDLTSVAGTRRCQPH